MNHDPVGHKGSVLVASNLNGFALRMDVLSKFGVHLASKLRLAFRSVAICTMASIGLCPRDSSSSPISCVFRFGVPAFRPPVLCPSAIYSLLL